MLDKQSIKQLIIHTPPNPNDDTPCKLEMIFKKKTLYKNLMRDSVTFNCSLKLAIEKWNNFNEYKRRMI